MPKKLLDRYMRYLQAMDSPIIKALIATQRWKRKKDGK